jgi:nucleoid-associated protein YgaU
MIDANRPQLRSGNPDLIFPGEVVTCPPTAEVGLGT